MASTSFKDEVRRLDKEMESRAAELLGSRKTIASLEGKLRELQ